MNVFYGRKIMNEEINSKTGKPWNLEDVPAYWQAAVGQWLKNRNQN